PLSPHDAFPIYRSGWIAGSSPAMTQDGFSPISAAGMNAGSVPQRREPVAEHDVVARDDAALERDALAFAPHLGADEIAGKDRPREPRLDAFQSLRPVLGAGAQNCARRNPEARRAVQNGPL